MSRIDHRCRSQWIIVVAIVCLGSWMPALADWTPMSSGTSLGLLGVWGTAPDDIFAVGRQGVVLHFDGETWTQMASSGTSEYLQDVWGSSSNDVYEARNHRRST